MPTKKKKLGDILSKINQSEQRKNTRNNIISSTSPMVKYTYNSYTTYTVHHPNFLHKAENNSIGQYVPYKEMVSQCHQYSYIILFRKILKIKPY